MKNIILLTSAYYAQEMYPYLLRANPDVAYINVSSPDELQAFPDDFLQESRLISFGSRFYVKKSLMDRVGFQSYNFHPGPPEFPGWAPFNFGIFSKVKQFGATLHFMNHKIDSGEIIAVKRFDCESMTTSNELMDETTQAMFELFVRFCPQFAHHQAPLSVINQQWSGVLTTKKDFQDHCLIDLKIDKEALTHRINSFGEGDGLSLPFLVLDGETYIYSKTGMREDQNTYDLHGFLFVKTKDSKNLKVSFGAG
jgi:methionyl-tRNA formyltransferase